MGKEAINVQTGPKSGTAAGGNTTVKIQTTPIDTEMAARRMLAFGEGARSRRLGFHKIIESHRQSTLIYKMEI